MFGEEAVESLRAALKVSPENIPLRLHLAGTLMSMGRAVDAETEFKAALNVAPRNSQILVGLAKCYWHQNKTSQSLVVIEDLARQNDAPAEAVVLFARLLLTEGKVQDAVAQYKRALELDPSCADRELADKLGVSEEANVWQTFEGRQREATEGEESELSFEMQRPDTKFADVGGMDQVKDEIALKIIYPLKQPELYKAYGKKAGGGILLFGPPGCGKTYLARATAGEIAASFISIGIHDVLDMWIGNSERNMHAIFEQARLNRPCVLFFDEVDALGGRRSDHRQGSSRSMVNQFLVELDGMNTENDGLLVLAATNAPWHVDSAFRRPGRFDRVIFVPPPDEPARAEILRLNCEGKPVQAIDFAKLAAKTDGMSGADLKSLIDRAVEDKLRVALKSGGIQPLTTADLLAASKQFKPSVREWFATAKNYAMYSNQDGSYDDVMKYLKLK